VMILGSLNEDSWPPAADASPWMSRPMMTAFGLPLPERRIGLSAHDFAQAFAAPRVWLTRATRIEGTPTVPSRWLLRLENLLAGTGAADALTRDSAQWLHWQRALDSPDAFRPVDRPAPTPPVEARPRRLSVTQIETWMRDPYAIYARHVLNLKALDPIDADPDAADYGARIHKALDRFVRETPGPLPPDALTRLLAAGRDSFGELLERPAIRAFWWPRFRRIADWFLALERDRHAGLRATASEVAGALTLDAPAGPFVLTAVADRIDTLADGSLAVIDYKTGAPPANREVAAGFAPQLPLEAAIAQAGGFAGAPAAPVSALEYWRLGGGDPAGERIVLAGDPGALTGEAIAGLRMLIARFDLPATPYESRPRPAVAPRFSDYEHLARVKEWSAGGAGEE
ncbi:MAG: PD-(D/E)XK nuclease family protein, partial [Rhodospirillales bacterium]